MMLELEMEGRAVGRSLGLGDGSTHTLESIEPTFQGLKLQIPHYALLLIKLY